MNAVADPAWSHTFPAPGPGLRVGAAVGGIALSWLIFSALHFAQRPPTTAPLIETVELRAVALPPPPPPPQVVAKEPPPPQLMEMTPLPSTSPVRFALTIDPVPAPRIPAQPRIEFRPEAFRPRAQPLEALGQRVFNVHDVDRIPVPIYRKIPRVPLGMLRQASSPVVRLTFLVTADGRVEDVRVVQADPAEMGQLVAEAVTHWRFEPAMKDGRRVRCVVLQPIRLQGGSAGPFSYQ